MRFPLWKRVASYFTDIYIESTSSEINEELHVILSKGRLQLCSANAIYSFEDLYKNFSLLFERLDYSFIKNQKILILGFGLGSIPILLEKYLKTSLEYIGIEKDEEVIYLANKYIIEKIKGSVQFVCADADAFVSNCMDEFDIILIDVFLDDVIPAELLQKNFLSKVKKLLHTKESLVIMNTLSNNAETTEASEAFYKEIFKEIFPTGKALTLHKNLMLLSHSQNLLNN